MPLSPPQHHHEHNSVGLVVVRNLFDRVSFKSWILFLFVFVAAPLLVITYVMLVNFPECQYEYEGFALLLYLTTFHFMFCLYDIIYYPFVHYLKFVRDKYSSSSNNNNNRTATHWTYICYHTALPFTLYFFLLGWLWSRAHTYVSDVFRYCFCAISFVYLLLLGRDCYSGNRNDMDSLTWFHGTGIIITLFASVVAGTILLPISGGGGGDGRFKEYTLLVAVTMFSCILLAKAFADRSLFSVSQYLVLAAYMLLIYSIASTLAAFRRMETFFKKRCADDDIEISAGELNIAKVAFYREIFREQTLSSLPSSPSSADQKQPYMNIDIAKALCILLTFALIVANVCLNYNFFSYMQIFVGVKQLYDYATSFIFHGGSSNGGISSDGFGRACIAMTFIFFLVNVACLISFQPPGMKLWWWTTIPTKYTSYLQRHTILRGCVYTLVGLIGMACLYLFFSQGGTRWLWGAMTGGGTNFIDNLHHVKSIDWTETMKCLVNVAFIAVTTKSILDAAEKVLSSNRHLTSNSQTAEIFFEIIVFGFSFFLLCQASFLFLHSPSAQQHRHQLRGGSAIGDYVPVYLTVMNRWINSNFNVLEWIVISFGAAMYDVYLTHGILSYIQSTTALTKAYKAVIAGETAVNHAGAARKADVPVAAILPALPLSNLFGYNSSSYTYTAQQPSPQSPPPLPPRKV